MDRIIPWVFLASAIGAMVGAFFQKNYLLVWVIIIAAMLFSIDDKLEKIRRK